MKKSKPVKAWAVKRRGKIDVDLIAGERRLVEDWEFIASRCAEIVRVEIRELPKKGRKNVRRS